jgi:hypothetical protein
MSFLKRRETAFLFYVVPMLACLFSHFFIFIPWLMGELINWAISIWTFSYLIGIYSMFRNRVELTIRRAPGWYYGIVTMAAFFILFGFGFLPHGLGYDWAILNVYTPIRMAIRLAGLINMVFLYRGARARSFDALIILFVVAVLVLAKSAIGPVMSPLIVDLGNFFNEAPNTGVMRAITVGMAVGLLVTFTRALLGLERTYMGEAAYRRGD